MENIQRGIITKGTRTEIIQTTAQMMWMNTKFPTSNEYTEVCRMLVTKYPVLKDSVGNGYVSIQVN